MRVDTIGVRLTVCFPAAKKMFAIGLVPTVKRREWMISRDWDLREDGGQAGQKR